MSEETPCAFWKDLRDTGFHSMESNWIHIALCAAEENSRACRGVCSSKSRVTMLIFGLVPSPLPLSQPRSAPLFTGKTDHRNDVRQSTWEFCQALFWLSFHLLLIHNCMLIQRSDFFPLIHMVAGFPYFADVIICLFIARQCVSPTWPVPTFQMSASEYWQKDWLWWHLVLLSGF